MPDKYKLSFIFNRGLAVKPLNSKKDVRISVGFLGLSGLTTKRRPKIVSDPRFTSLDPQISALWLSRTAGWQLLVLRAQKRLKKRDLLLGPRHPRPVGHYPSALSLFFTWTTVIAIRARNSTAPLIAGAYSRSVLTKKIV
jgi:hypothetical protein